MTRSAGEDLGMLPRTDHQPGRPSWDCTMCEHSWPCANAKSDLAAQFDRHPTGLAIYMASAMYDAVEDLTALGTPVPADLYDRFLAWVT